MARCDVCGGVAGWALPVGSGVAEGRAELGTGAVGAEGGVPGNGGDGGAGGGAGSASGPDEGPGATIDRLLACDAGSGTGRVGRMVP